jgi:hypothetical protein
MLIKTQAFLIFESKYKVEQHIKNLGIPIIGPTFFMENLPGTGLEQGQLALPLSSSSVLQQSALQNIAEFSALALEHRKLFLGKRIDVASGEVTGEQAAEILSNVLGYKIKYMPISLEQVYRTNEDMARMYECYEKVGTGVDIATLHREHSDVNWLTLKVRIHDVTVTYCLQDTYSNLYNLAYSKHIRLYDFITECDDI